MTPPRSIISSIAQMRIIQENMPRRLLFAGLLTIALLFSAFPERYRAASSLTPSDPNTLGLSGALGQLGAMNSVFGNQAAIEVALKVGRSVYVRDTVMRRTRVDQRLGLSRIEAHRWLADKVEVRSLRGSILLIEMHHRDADLARDLVEAYADATRARLAEINRRQTEYKRSILMKLVSDSSNRLARAQNAYDGFRLRTRYADPEAAMVAIGGRIPVLEAAIQAKDVQLNSARKFYTDENMIIRQLVSERDALVDQLAEAKAINPDESNSVGRVVKASTEADRLERELYVSKLLYDSYIRFLQGTSVEDLTSEASVRVLEAPFVDTERQFDYRWLALATAIAMLWAAVEFYRLRPPVGDRIVVRERHA
jgi:capsule polysaccharide export protein KpsE/RkpR